MKTMKKYLYAYGCCLAVLVLALTLGCEANKKNSKYKIDKQPPARYLTPERSADDVVRFDERACPPAPAVSGGAYEYLKALTVPANRRTGTQGYRCAESFVKKSLTAMGYDVREVVYHFPYYEFDLSAVKVTRTRDGRDFPAYPLLMSAPTGEGLTGKVVRPRRDLAGCFVYVNPEEPWTGTVQENYEKWKKAGALGVVREATIKPLATRGLRHAGMAHTTSWHYAPLPGAVVERAHELIGQTITMTTNGRIVQGTGYTVVAQSPKPADKYVVATAHLDSWFQGALDDGTGSAALLEAARLLKDDSQGVIFLFADSEEVGLIGSAAFVQGFDLHRVSALVELDMVSTRYNYGHRHSPDTATIMPRFISISSGARPSVKKSLAGLGGHNFIIPVDWSAQLFGGLSTDMNWFYYAGVPGAFIYTPSKFYHTERDTLEWVPPEDLQAVAEAITRMVRAFRVNPLPAPKSVQPFEFSVAPAAGDTVEFKVAISPKPATATVAVRCYFEQGLEKKVMLKEGKDGQWRGEFKLPRPGEWQFAAAVVVGNKSGKQGKTLTVREKQ
jgi:hypothetical protein